MNRLRQRLTYFTERLLRIYSWPGEWIRWKRIKWKGRLFGGVDKIPPNEMPDLGFDPASIVAGMRFTQGLVLLSKIYDIPITNLGIGLAYGKLIRHETMSAIEWKQINGCLNAGDPEEIRDALIEAMQVLDNIDVHRQLNNAHVTDVKREAITDFLSANF